MVAGRVVLDEIVGLVVTSWLPVHAELALLHPIANPVESHVHGLGLLCFDCVVGDSFGCGVVRCHWSGTVLNMSHLCQRVSDCVAFLSVSEEAT
mmetsp:Transcript_45299/g.45853  ORF Transcript_45299/g.45853 Transcript_45299/m.45853 type:complete len:94 (-) Transcript_45299:150-431(-)